MTRLTSLSPAHVDTLRSALRLAIRTEKQTLSHERRHMPPGAVQSVEARIRDMQALADGLSPSAPPALPAAEPEPEFRCPYCGPRAAPVPAAGITCDDRR